MIRITKHAVLRYQERVAPVTAEKARASILSHCKALECAAAMGAKIVRCGDGSRLILAGSTVTTVLGKDMASSRWAA